LEVERVRRDLEAAAAFALVEARHALRSARPA